MRSRKTLAWVLFCAFFLFASSCTSEQNNNRTSSEQLPSSLNSQTNKSPESTNTLPSRPQSNSTVEQLDNQMSVAELRERLDEVMAIERESRRMIA